MKLIRFYRIREKELTYDQYGHAAFSPGGATGFGGGSPFSQGGQWGPFSYTYTSAGGGSPFESFDFNDPFEILSNFGGSPFGRTRSIPRYSITLDFMEAVKGCEKEVTIDGRKRKIKIPAGVDEGARINFGDFTLSVNIRPHHIFERDGADIYVRLLIPFSLAVLGGEAEVPTLDGQVKIRVRAGTQSGTTIRLRGLGINKIHSRGKGDEYVRLVVLVPEKLNPRQRELLHQLKTEGL